MDDYDKWKTTEPDYSSTKCVCTWCKQPLYFDDEYWNLDDEVYCQECAEQWLEDHKYWVTDEMVRGR